ncbi:MAG: hypothetical protein H7Y28_14150, partial [Rhodoferax sp.]|nr:hypothetical protein [Rhodoferax sp.]
MFEFLGRGKHKADKAGGDAGPSTQPKTVQLGATQIEMVRMTLHGVLKLHGIPGTWISGEVVPVHIPGQGDALLLQLEVMHWHDALVLHAPTFQKALLDGLTRFDPHADPSRYLFSWKFSPKCGCPHVQLPAPDFWVTSERVVLAPVATALAAPRQAAPRKPFDLP